jgi:hypothetical protein
MWCFCAQHLLKKIEVNEELRVRCRFLHQMKKKLRDDDKLLGSSSSSSTIKTNAKNDNEQ